MGIRSAFGCRATSRHQSEESYASYQRAIAERHLLPLLRAQGVPLDRPILDVGCATGGMAIALAERLRTPVEGCDALADRIAAARRAAAAATVRVDFRILDLIRDPLPAGRYGLLLLRDVVEHLADLPTALERLRTMVDRGGMLYVTFPPWGGPYAGHQHNARGIGKFLPYAHALAPGTFLAALHRWEAGREDWLADERQIFTNRLSRRRFEEVAAATGWTIVYRRTWFIRPALMRAGLPKIPNGFLGRLPFVGDALSTACEYLLAPARPAEARVSPPPRSAGATG